MDWQLVARAGVRYTAVYAGLTVGALYWLTGVKLVLLLPIALGLLMLLGALNGTISGTEKQTAVFTRQSDGHSTPASELPSSIKPLFYGIGLLLFSAAVLVVL